MFRKTERFRNPRMLENEGSITPLIFAYFTIAMLLIFLVANVAAAYVARRDLTSRVEASISRAAQELDELRYYYAGPATDFLAGIALERGSLLVPIDCQDAARVFRSSLSLFSKADSLISSRDNVGESAGEAISAGGILTNQPEIESFLCEEDRLSVRVRENFELPFRMPIFGLNIFVNRVEVDVDSIYR